MPWKVSGVMDERARFVLEYERGEASMAELCRVYGISRKTGYKWWQRYGEVGIKGLEDLSRASGRHPNQMAEEIEEQLLALRRAHMRWGARKLLGQLQTRPGGV